MTLNETVVDAGARDLNLRFEYFEPDMPGENCRVHGAKPELETFVWRLVSEKAAFDRGEFCTAATASEVQRETFDYLWYEIA
jgi:hypothetical protein